MINNMEVGTKSFLRPRNSPEIYRVSPFMRMVDETYIHDSSSFLSSELDILINQAANYHVYTQMQHRSHNTNTDLPSPTVFPRLVLWPHFPPGSWITTHSLLNHQLLELLRSASHRALHASPDRNKLLTSNKRRPALVWTLLLERHEDMKSRSFCPGDTLLSLVFTTKAVPAFITALLCSQHWAILANS